jgi:large subunit ribosomal protein L23
MRRQCARPDVTLATAQRRGRFYRPFFSHGQDLWDRKQVQFHQPQAWWQYKHQKMDPKPIPESELNNLYGKKRLWNPIPSATVLAARKHEEFGWPHRDPPPTGLRKSWEYFPHWFDKYFPNVQCRLVIDSVLNKETTRPSFRFPCHVSKQEITNYLQNVHGFENVTRVTTRNIAGMQYKNEVGAIKQMEDYKEVQVTLDSPVIIELKQVKETSDVGDSKTDDKDK